MATERGAQQAAEAPLGRLEQSFIDEFVRGHGYDPGDLSGLPEKDRHALLTQASVYASSRLMEVESRAKFVHEIHDGGVHG